MQEELYDFIRKIVEDTLLLGLPRLMEPRTPEVPHTFLEHLQKLCLHLFSIPHSWSLIKLPSLVSLEIQADTLRMRSPRYGLKSLHLNSAACPTLRSVRIVD